MISTSYADGVAKQVSDYINNIIPPNNNFIGEIYNDLKDEDGFLYITYSSENTFG